MDPSSAASFFTSALGQGHLCLRGGCSQRVSLLVLAVLRDRPQVLWGLAMKVIFHMTLSKMVNKFNHFSLYCGSEEYAVSADSSQGSRCKVSEAVEIIFFLKVMLRSLVW